LNAAVATKRMKMEDEMKEQKTETVTSLVRQPSPVKDTAAVLTGNIDSY